MTLLLVMAANAVGLWPFDDELSYCRGDSASPPHQASLWHDGFPSATTPAALCEGSVVEQNDGTICIDGRLTYAQIAEALGRPTFAPAASSISINGHLTGGSANFVFGAEAAFLYDFVKNFRVDGIKYDAGPDLTNKLLAASSGQIDGVCLKPDFAMPRSAFYSISSQWLPASAPLPEDALTGASLAFFSLHSVVVERHTQSETDGTSWGASLGMRLFNAIAGIPLPSFVVSAVPGFLSLTGLLRLAMIGGTFSLDSAPQPLLAPGLAIENVQIDTEWSTFVAAVQGGLFRDAAALPLSFGVVVKKIVPAANATGCWSVPTAAIDIQAPVGEGPNLDEYTDAVVWPRLAAIGSVGLHFGKRLPAGSRLLRSALDKYSSCGAETGLSINPAACYHPMCERAEAATEFVYPSSYYAA